MGLVWGVEGWVIIVIILLFLLTPGAMLSILNALSALIPSNLMKHLFFTSWVEADAQPEGGNYPKSHSKVQKKILTPLLSLGVGVGQDRVTVAARPKAQSQHSP